MSKNKNNSSPPPFDIKMYRIFKWNEWLWLFFSILSIILCVYSLIIKNNDQSMYFIVLTLMAGIFYALKRAQRKRYEKRKTE
jgi:preprotein translocase subunit YajC